MKKIFKAVIMAAGAAAVLFSLNEAAFRIRASKEPGNVIYTIRGEAVLDKYYENLDELIRDSDIIVLGECVKEKAFRSGSFDWTESGFEILEGLKGELKTGDRADIDIMGRNMTVRDYMSLYKELPYELKEKAGEIKDTDIISMVYLSDRIPLEGERAILFLSEDEDTPGKYWRTGSYQGALYEEAQGDEKTETDEVTYTGALGSYSLNEIKRMIENTVF